MTYNKIYVSFGALRKITGPALQWQYNETQYLIINDLNLPEYYAVDFMNQGDTNTIRMTPTEEGVLIPDQYLLDGRPLIAYIVVIDGESVNTIAQITLPVNTRGEPSDISPEPARQQQIDSLIAALNSGVASAEAAAKRAEDASTHTPQIVDGYWYLWDSDTEQYVTSGVKAEGIDGDDGVGISSARLNADYTLTLVFTDGREYTTPVSIRGPKGDPFTYEDFTEAQKAELVQGPIQEAQTSAVNAVGTARLNAINAVNQAGTAKVTEINQAGTSAVNSVNQAGETQVNAVNQAGTTQVGNVQTEGNTQIQAVEDKGAEVLEHIPPDYTDLVDDVADLSRHLSDLEDTVSTTQIINSASGAIASFSDGADSMPVRKLVAQIEPVQDLHGYGHPWPAGGGVNLYNKDADYFGQSLYWSAGSGVLVGSAEYYGSPKIPIRPETEYVRTAGTLANNFYDANGDFLTSTYKGDKFTSPSDAYFVTFNIANSINHDVAQLEKGTTLSAYSPYSNECPISGHTGAEIERTGKNLLAKPIVLFSTDTPISDCFFMRAGDYVLTCDCLNTYRIGFRLLSPDGALITNADYAPATNWIYNASAKAFYAPVDLPSGHRTTSFTLVSDCYVRIVKNNNDVTNVMIRLPSDTEAYEPYTGNQISVNWEDEAGTIYGGTITLNSDGSADVVSAMGNIASYDGETLPGTWISSMDVYAEGSTPTTGAQVVYELAEPVSYHFDDVGQLKTFLGNNNIWCDIGDTTVEYSADTKLYIDRKIAEALGG